ncbi:MAG: substrate-binding domain-containing protein [Euryarchaeota archaeon]|nr:substrate-binding domain-containing protein [Euryarchaeota archaeon]
MNIGTRINDMFKGMWEDTRAVSPIVATLVLVVVAITGAAAVGTIMGTFSSDVSEQSNTGELASASSTEILIAGSTTVQPVSELLAEAYMDEHQGVKITVQGGGSGAGVSSAGMGIVDIGAASRDPKDAELGKYPKIKTHQIGGSAVVVIAGKDITAFNIDREELKTAYQDGDPDKITTNLPANASIGTLYQRAEASGTEETFAKWLGLTEDKINSSIEGATGNAGVLAAVQGAGDSIGFVDYGFADGASDIVILGISDTGRSGKEYKAADVTKKNIKTALKKNDDGKYPTGKVDGVDGLTRPLNYMTNGDPSSMEQAFITFAQSPGATSYFEQCGYFAVTEFA